MNENENLDLIFEMLLTIESRINALIEFSIDDIEAFDEVTQKHRTIILKRVLKVRPEAQILLRQKE